MSQRTQISTPTEHPENFTRPAPGNDFQAKTGPKSHGKQPHKIRKLAASRPFPIVPTSVSATGPRSAHKEGKNKICITRKTSLGAYMRRCKQVVVSDGYKTLFLSAMGAAIPHLAQLSVALPPILPFGAEDIETEIITGTHQVHDEIVPEDEEEDIAYQSRNKSTLMVIIKIQGGDPDPVLKVGTKRKRNQGPVEEPEQLEE